MKSGSWFLVVLILVGLAFLLAGVRFAVESMIRMLF